MHDTAKKCSASAPLAQSPPPAIASCVLAFAALLMLAGTVSAQSVTVNIGSINPDPVITGQPVSINFTTTTQEPAYDHGELTLNGPAWTWSLSNVKSQMGTAAPAADNTTGTFQPANAANTALSMTFTSPGKKTGTVTATATWTFAWKDSTVHQGQQPPGPVSAYGSADFVLTVVTLSLEINNTAATDDDVVRLKSVVGKNPVKRFTVDCRVKISPVLSTDMDVVLSNPDGRLRFPDAADTTRKLTLPKNGATVAFKISGESGSKKVGDAKIEVHKDTANGFKCASQGATVFYFEPNDITVEKGSGKYVMNGDTYGPAGGTAVDFSAVGTIQPPGINYQAPQIKNIKIGIVQNLVTSERRAYYEDPEVIAWDVSIPSGTSIDVPSQMSAVIRSQNLNDAINDAALPLATKDPNALVPPKPVQQGSVANSSDSPSCIFGSYRIYDKLEKGIVIAKVKYRRKTHTTMKETFRDWAVTFDATANNETVPLRESSWSLDVDSAKANQTATPIGKDKEPENLPLLTLPIFNDELNTQSNYITEPVGNAVITLTKP